MKLDLKGWKKFSTNAKNTTLVHSKHGHKLVLSHKSLSPENREALDGLAFAGGEQGEAPKAFAKGGKIMLAGGTETPIGQGSPDPNSTAVSDEAYERNKAYLKEKYANQEREGGHMVAPPTKKENEVGPGIPERKNNLGYADGGEVADQNATPAQPTQDTPEAIAQDAAQSPPQDPNQKYQDLYQKNYEQQRLNNPGAPDVFSRESALGVAQRAKNIDISQQYAQKASFDDQSARIAQENTERAKIGLPPRPVPSGFTPLLDTPNGPKPDPSGGAISDIPPAGPAPFNAANEVSGAYDQMLAANKAMENAHPGEQMAEVHKRQAEQAQALQDHYMEQHNKIEGEMNNVIDDIRNGHINPDQYMESKSTVGKVSTAIGLLLGGIGAGLSHGDNVALSFLNKQIERNIDAQKANLGQKNNLLGALQKQFGNLHDSTAISRSIQAQVFGSQIEEASNRINDPIKRAQLQQQAAAFKMQYAPQVEQAKLRQAALQGLAKGHIDPDAAVRFIVTDPKDKEAANKELAKVEEVESLRKNMEGSANDLQSKTLNGLFSPRDRESAVQAFAGQIAKVAEGRFNLEESKTQAKALLPMPGDSEETMINKSVRRQQFFDSLGAGTPVLHSYGIKVPRAMPIKKLAPNVK